MSKLAILILWLALVFFGGLIIFAHTYDAPKIEKVILSLGFAIVAMTIFCGNDSSKTERTNHYKINKNQPRRWALMFKKMLIIFITLSVSVPVFSQNSVSKKFRCNALVTEKQREDILLFIQKNKDFCVRDTSGDYEILRKGKIYATLSKVSNNSAIFVTSGKTTPLFSLRCIEDKEELLGTAIEYKEIDAQSRK